GEVAVHRHGGALGEHRAVGCAEAAGELGHHLDVSQPGDAGAAENGAPRLLAVDDARADGGAGLDFLVRPQLDVGPHDGAFAEGAMSTSPSLPAPQTQMRPGISLPGISSLTRPCSMSALARTYSARLPTSHQYPSAT